MQIILRIIFHFIGGAASGSFYVPYNKSEELALGKFLDCWRTFLLASYSAGSCVDHGSTSFGDKSLPNNIIHLKSFSSTYNSIS
ncbi:hypothetical protein [Ginsengibacter hankyongi]|uniref:hypothetical protein n=1 Tax=Ginsengibacter hankyongi TaxID=2607284 RepID=UPI002938DAA2|nr:hypothetical protein [Ginsengibacter hankyongi]